MFTLHLFTGLVFVFLDLVHICSFILDVCRIVAFEYKLRFPNQDEFAVDI